MSAIHIADTGLFVAVGHPSNRRYQVLRTFARRNGVTFVLPKRVYEELSVTAQSVDTPPIDTAIDDGWARISRPLEYTNALVSQTMDAVQRYIANADDRPADEIERADPALAGVAAQAFINGTADHAYIYTTEALLKSSSLEIYLRESTVHSTCALSSPNFYLSKVRTSCKPGVLNY